MSHDVFISYAGEDKSAADTTCTTLESEGISCWIAPRDVRPGAQWEKAIMDAISASRVMVLVFSEYANRSEHVQREVGSAFENGITVIPFRISDMRPTGVLAYYLRPCSGSMRLRRHSRSMPNHWPFRSGISCLATKWGPQTPAQ